MLVNSGKVSYEARRIFCVGRNYAAHVSELGNEVPKEPVFFMKPASSIVPVGGKILFPSHGNELQHEAELVVLIGKHGQAATEAEAISFIAGLSFGLDLTLRDVQADLKEKGLPWEKSKAFEMSAPLGEKFCPFDGRTKLDGIEFSCYVNDVLKQSGNTRDMIFPVKTLIVAFSRIWILSPGDMIYTGTPEGVSSLHPGDEVRVESSLSDPVSWTIV